MNFCFHSAQQLDGVSPRMSIPIDTVSLSSYAPSLLDSSIASSTITPPTPPSRDESYHITPNGMSLNPGGSFQSVPDVSPYSSRNDSSMYGQVASHMELNLQGFDGPKTACLLPSPVVTSSTGAKDVHLDAQSAQNMGGMVVHVENPDSLFSIGQEQHHSGEEQQHSDQVTKNSVLASEDLFKDPVSKDSNEDLFSDPVPKDSNEDLFTDPVPKDSNEDLFTDPVPKDSSEDPFSDPVPKDSIDDLFRDPVPKDSIGDLFSDPVTIDSLFATEELFDNPVHTGIDKDFSQKTPSDTDRQPESENKLDDEGSADASRPRKDTNASDSSRKTDDTLFASTSPQELQSTPVPHHTVFELKRYPPKHDNVSRFPLSALQGAEPPASAEGGPFDSTTDAELQQQGSDHQHYNSNTRRTKVTYAPYTVSEGGFIKN